MNRTCALITLHLLLAWSCAAQEFQNRPITFGPMLGIMGSMSTSTYHVDNTANSGRLAFSVGGQADFPLGVSTSISTTVRYYLLAFYDKNTHIDNPSQSLYQMMITRGNFGYLGITALLNVHHILVGGQFGIPVRVHAENCRAEAPLVPSKVLELRTSDVNTLVEIKLGYQFESRITGDRPVTIQIVASYPINAMLRESARTRPMLDENFHIPSISFDCTMPFAL
jgi:hypothetical protein